MQVELESPKVPSLQGDTKPSSQASHLPLQRADSLDPLCFLRQTLSQRAADTSGLI